MRQALLLLAVLAAVPASAKCMSPQPFVLPRPGSKLPPNPTLYFFSPPAQFAEARTRPESLRAVTQAGAELRLIRTPMTGGGALGVVRLQVVAPEGTRFHLQPRLNSTLEWSVESSFTEIPDLQLVRGKDGSSSWMCSYEATRVLDTNLAAPAWRVKYAETEELLRAGKGQAVVVEGEIGGFGSGDLQKVPPRAVSLGHHNCWGSNLIWKTPTLAVRVTALLADGTERKSETIVVLEAPKRAVER